MIVIDASAVIAIMFGEPNAALVVQAPALPPRWRPPHRLRESPSPSRHSKCASHARVAGTIFGLAQAELMRLRRPYRSIDVYLR